MANDGIDYERNQQHIFLFSERTKGITFKKMKSKSRRGDSEANIFVFLWVQGVLKVRK